MAVILPNFAHFHGLHPGPYAILRVTGVLGKWREGEIYWPDRVHIGLDGRKYQDVIVPSRQMEEIFDLLEAAGMGPVIVRENWIP